MNRRESLKAIGFSAISTSVLIDACKTKDKEQKDGVASNDDNAGREQAEIDREAKLSGETYFTPHEMATITILADIIIPKDDRSGSASDAKVPEFIEYIVKDIPEHQLPMRGGLRWLDTQCLNLYNNTFKDCSARERIEIIDRIAYPEEATPDMQQGVAFFNRMRDLTASGFFTSKMGIDDLGYMGNRPGKWEGVPADVLQKYGMQNV
jgi:gluconate 2-dehydrogenase gamma chain